MKTEIVMGIVLKLYMILEVMSAVFNLPIHKVCLSYLGFLFLYPVWDFKVEYGGKKKKRKEKNPENIEWGVCVLFLW